LAIAQKAAAMLKHYAEPQAHPSLKWMLERVKGCNVAPGGGIELRRDASQDGGSDARGSTIVSVDMPCDGTPKFLQPLENLKRACKQISQLGGNVQLLIGDSHNAGVIEAAQVSGRSTSALSMGITATRA
jgi:hypothetical protein